MTLPWTTVVLHVAETSGPSRDLETDLEWLADAGRLEVVVPGPGPAAEALRDRASVTELAYSTATLPRGPIDAVRAAIGLVRDARAFRAHLRERDPDLVVVATTWLPTAVLAARLEGIPAIAYAAEMRTQDSTRRSLRARRRIALWELTRRLATGIVACSESAAAEFERRGTTAAVVHSPIADEYAGGDRAGFRAAHGIEPAEPCVLTLGNVTRGRGQDTLMRALPAIRRAVPPVRCALGGLSFARPADLAFRDLVLEVARQARVSDRVVWTGFVERVADAYAAADVVVNPARQPESFGRVACEALVAGKPVVATRVGAVPEVLRDGETALLVPPEDPEALANAVVRLLEDRDLGRRLAEAGRADVLERFAPERSQAAFRRVIEGVTSGTPARGARGRARG